MQDLKQKIREDKDYMSDKVERKQQKCDLKSFENEKKEN